MTKETLLSSFIDFEELVSAMPHGNGHINDTYKAIVLREGQPHSYLLQRFNDRIFKHPEEVMANIQMVANHLSQQEYPLTILQPYPTRSGSLLQKDGQGDLWRLFDFIENTIAHEQVASPQLAFEAAKGFGAFAKALGNIKATELNETIPGFHDGEKRMADFRAVLLVANGQRLAAAKTEIDAVLEHSSIFKKVSSLDLPLRAIHHDTKINNVLFDKNTGKAACVIDLDTVMPGTILSDIGDMVRTFTGTANEDEADLSEVNVRMDIYDALSEGFLSEMSDQLTAEERDHFYLAGIWLTLMQVVRFLGDYLAGDVYYKTKYPGHNLVRAKNQLALFLALRKSLAHRKTVQ